MAGESYFSHLKLIIQITIIKQIIIGLSAMVPLFRYIFFSFKLFYLIKLTSRQVVSEWSDYGAGMQKNISAK